MNDQLTAILGELRHYFESLYGERLVKVVLFGSQARGDARSDSDIVISRTFVLVKQFQDETGGFFCNIRREGIAI